MAAPTLPAPAKINLHLRITGRRADGYHLLDTSFAFTDLCDSLTFAPHRERIVLTCDRPELAGAANLVHRLLDAFRRRHAVREGLRIAIEKRIPQQAGLGGGSSDAATALLVANQAWGIRLDRRAMIDFAAPFGADIPCFLFGAACRTGGSIGERLSPWRAPLPDGALLLAHPGAGLSTAEVFAEHDAIEGSLTTDGGGDTMRAPSPPALGSNDLFDAATMLLPPLANLLDAMRARARTAWMSGSGSCCAALFDHREAAAACAGELVRRGLARWCHVGSLRRHHPVDDDAVAQAAAMLEQGCDGA
ncbi:MAG: 4-(cytidine 5'-diphospho)-2-C-methyl-D-erythritol kinase [Zetaproteobacteria bacterium]|nr:MAG: 4-(cytidine 5'-diphospho)-2-C-methyl-D-erythritol kinase [Zetaproteobacteria bacterium]